MATEYTRSRHVALVVEDPRLELWTAQCSGTQAGPRAGVPVPQQVCALALGATGDMTSTSVGLEIQTRRGGGPILDGAIESSTGRVVDRGALFIWRRDGDASTAWRGHDPPRYIADWQGVAATWSDASGNFKYVKDPYLLSAPNGDLLVIAQVREVSASGGEYRLECIRRTAASSTWTRVLIEGEASAPAQDYVPAALVLPSGRIVAWRWRRQTTGAAVNGLRMWYSDDAGLTWSFGGDGMAGRGTTRTPTRTRLAYSGEQILMLVLCSSGEVEQYASADLRNFVYVALLDDDTNDYVSPDVVATDDGFLVVYGGGDTSATSFYARIVANAFESVESSPESSAIGTLGTTGALSLVMDDCGIIYCYYRVSSASNVTYALLTVDGGRTWSNFGSDAPLSDFNDAGTYINRFSVAWWRGQVVMAHQWAATPGDEDESLGIAYLGGYTTVQMPRDHKTMAASACCGWNYVWLPLDLPGDTGWTAAGTAATEVLASPGKLQLNTTAANVRTYTLTPTATTDQGFMVLIDCTAVTSGSITTNRRGVLVRNGDGAAHSYRVDVRIGTTGWALYDATSAAQIGTDQTFSTLVRFEILVAIQGASVATWYRVKDTTIGGARSWTAGPSSTTLSDAGALGNSLVWGHRTTAADACETDWYSVRWTTGDGVGQNIAGGFTNPTDLVGRPYAWRGRGVYVEDEVALQARGGPTDLGDAWDIEVEYDYGWDRVLEANPRREHRTTADSATAEIAVRWSSVGDPPLDTDLLAVCGLGSNWSRVQIFGYDEDTTAWVSIGTYDLHSDLVYARQGSSVISGGSGDTPFFKDNEHKGGSFAFSGTVSREILRHPEGRWSTSATSRKTALHLDGVTTGDGASGTGALIGRQWCVLIALNGTRYSGVKITHVAADSTNPPAYTADRRLGRLVVGPAYIMGHDPDWGRIVTPEAGDEVVRLRDRQVFSRVAAPVARVVELPWVGGIDQTQVESSTADPDYLTGGGTPIATKFGTAYVLEGLQRAVDGGARQVVYLPLVTGSAQTLLRRDEMMLGRIEAGPGREVAVGDELTSEVVRIPTVVIREDV